ncbi:MAG: CaiB/BaiF CoA transferase family protein [Alphaproteobacteria bacterium]
MPLSGIRVIDLTRILAGPFCTQMLADMGAEVIKIESPEGDPVRVQGAVVNGFSWYFAQFNRNKKSIVLDLYSDAGKTALADLIRGADVLVENFRPGVLARMGFDADRLKALNPGLVVGSVNGFGSTGPYVDRPSFDFIAQAMSGFMATTGEQDGDPMRAGPPIADQIAGLYCAFGIVCALRARDGAAAGAGQRVEAALSTGLISMMAYLSAERFATGREPVRTGNNHPIVAPYGLFRAADGRVAVAPSTQAMVERFMACIGLSHLLADPRFETNALRMANRPALLALIDDRMQRMPVDHWIAAVNAAGCPCGRVMDLGEVFSDPQVLAQQMVIDYDQPGRGPARIMGFPVKLSETPARLHRPPPELGQHTDAVLADLGYDAARIAAARGEG